MVYYFAALLISNVCLWFVDKTYNLQVWQKKFIPVLLAGLVFFILFDFIGITLDVFTHNPERIVPISPFGAKFPVEELVFLHLLIYVTALTQAIIHKKVSSQ